MKLEPGQISRSQAVYLVFVAIFGTASIELPGTVVGVAGRDGWMSVLLASAVTLLSAALWLFAAARWPGRDLIELPGAAAGPWVGRLIGAGIVVWLFSLVTGAVWIASDVVLMNFLPETPKAVVIASVVAPAAMAVYGRLETVTRLNHVVFWCLMFLVISYLPFSPRDMELPRMMPVLEKGLGPVLKGIAVPLGIFTENLILVAVLPFVNYRAKPGRLLGAITLLVAISMAFLTILVTAVFGPDLTARFHQPILKLSHVVSIGDILERLDAAVILLWSAGVIAKIAFWYWLLCLSLARLFGLRDYRPLVWPMSLLITVTGYHWAEVSNEYDSGLASWTSFTVIGIGFLLPAFLLTAGFIRGAVGKGSKSA